MTDAEDKSTQETEDEGATFVDSPATITLGEDDDEEPGSTGGDETPETTTSAGRRRTQLAGEDYEVDPAVAEAIRREIDTRAGRYGAELDRIKRENEELKRWREDQEKKGKAEAAPETPSVTQPDAKLIDVNSPDYNPQEYHRQSMAYQEALVVEGLLVQERHHKEQEAAREKKTTEQRVWDDRVAHFFGQVAPELKGYEEQVDHVWKKNLGTLAGMETAAGLKRLKELTIDHIIRVGKKGQELGAQRRTPRLETSRRRAPAARTTKPQDETLGSAADDFREIQRKQRGVA